MIPAILFGRKGSIGFPGKNLYKVLGRPLLYYPLLAAKYSSQVDQIFVSTDDEEITEIANAWGAETPFVRPTELANDYTATVPVVAHAIEACRTLGWKFDQVCCIYPGVPFIQINDLNGALASMNNSKADYCFPVTEYPSAIQRALKLLSNGRTKPFYPEFEITRTQDLELAYYDAGQFYWGKTEAWLTNPKIHCNGLGYPIPNWRVVDIDTPEDWQRAEIIYRTIHNSDTTF